MTKTIKIRRDPCSRPAQLISFSLDVMIAVAAWQHIAVGFLVISILPFVSARWIRSEGVAIALVGLGAGFGQIALGLIKPGLSFSDAERVLIAAFGLAGAIVGGWRIVRRGRNMRKNI